MNKYRFPALLMSTAMAFFMISCGPNQQKAATDTNAGDSTTATTTSAPAAASTIVTTPQSMMTATHKVANFAKWKASFDAHDSLRLASGIHSYVIGRSIEDSNVVLVATKVDDMNKAKAFVKDPSLKQAMQKGGVTGTPSFSFVTMVFQDTAAINTDLRSRTSFTVKDFEAWRKVFDSHKQTRIDNGIVDRAYGHDADDDHKVTLVVAISDSAKANAFWKSDLLKQQRAESGVTSAPQRFIYHMVQRY